MEAITRRQALRLGLGVAATGLLAACGPQPSAPAASPGTTSAASTSAATSSAASSPAVAPPSPGRKVTLKFWTWADNPVHQKMFTDSIDMFHKAQSNVAIQLDVSPTVLELRKKTVAAFAAGAAPDVAGMYHPHIQDYFEGGIVQPIEDYFKKWDQREDFFPNVVEVTRGKPGQPILALANGLVVIVLFYRQDLFDEAKLKPPVTYDEMIEAARKLTKAPDLYGYALRGGDYFGTQPVQSVWRSAGVKMVDEKGEVDFDSPAAVEVTEKWAGMLTKDKSAPPSAVSDRYPQLFALFQGGKVAIWMYPMIAQAQLNSTFGEKVQVVVPPRVKDAHFMEMYPEGVMMLTSAKEKDAAWEFLMHMTSGEPARIFSRDRGELPTRKSIAAEPTYQQSRFFKLGLNSQSIWWVPPFGHKHWVKYQEGITPFWQQTLRGEISAKDFHRQGARLLRGQA